MPLLRSHDPWPRVVSQARLCTTRLGASSQRGSASTRVASGYTEGTEHPRVSDLQSTRRPRGEVEGVVVGALAVVQDRVSP
jgi:hypothetical protein